MNFVIESDRLYFRKLTSLDYNDLSKILKDIEIMYAWEHSFTDTEVIEWVNKNTQRYEKDGFSYFAVIEKTTHNFLGVMGPLMENISGTNHIGIAYILNKKYWGKGFGIEGAKACVDYAFNTLEAEKVIAEVQPDNSPSRKVAEKLGMCVVGEFIKYYNGKNMPHLIYSIDKSSWINMNIQP